MKNDYEKDTFFGALEDLKSSCKKLCKDVVEDFKTSPLRHVFVYAALIALFALLFWGGKVMAWLIIRILV